MLTSFCLSINLDKTNIKKSHGKCMRNFRSWLIIRFRDLCDEILFRLRDISIKTITNHQKALIQTDQKRLKCDCFNWCIESCFVCLLFLFSRVFVVKLKEKLSEHLQFEHSISLIQMVNILFDWIHNFFHGIKKQTKKKNRRFFRIYKKTIGEPIKTGTIEKQKSISI